MLFATATVFSGGMTRVLCPALRPGRASLTWVAKEIGALAKPDDIRFTDTLPKTRSGKIIRGLLRELATNGDVKGGTTTLEDFSVIARLKEHDEVRTDCEDFPCPRVNVRR